MSKSSIAKKNIILVLISLLIAFAFCEMIVRMFVPVRSVGPSFTVYDSLYGKRLKKSFSATRVTPEFNMLFSTNSYGFRGPEPPSFPSSPILFLGDSFTMGYGVNDGEEFPALIRKALSSKHGTNAIPVINAGMGDNGNGRWVKFLRYKGKDYNPRLVVLQIMDNDFHNNITEGLFELSSNNELFEIPVPSISIARIVQNFIEKIPGLSYSYFFGLANQAIWSIKYTQPDPLSQQDSKSLSLNEGDQLTYEILRKVLTICDQESWPTLVLIVGVGGDRLMKLEHILQEKKIPIMRVPNRKDHPDLYYKIDGHWNRRGHAFAAELIINKMQEQDYIQLP